MTDDRDAFGRNDETERFDQLGRYWDRLARDDAIAHGEDSPAWPLDSTLLEALQRFHELGTTPPPGAARDRVWRELHAQMDVGQREQETLVQATATLAHPRVAPIPNGRGDPRHRRPATQPIPIAMRRRVGSIFSLAAAAVLLLALVGGLLAIRFGMPGSGDGRFGSVPAAQVAPDATPATGPIEFLWETRGDPASPLGNPAHIAVAPDGNIWVADGDNNRFQIFAPNGAFLESWGTAGSGDGEFDFSVIGWSGYDYGAVAFAPDGALYVADPGNHRIQKFGPDRTFLYAWGSEGAEPGQFILPMDLVVDGQGRVYVADADSDLAPAGPSPYIQVFDADGRFLAEWGERGSEPGQMNTPFGIGLDPANGTLLVAEFNGNRVQRFTPEGEVLDGWGEGGSLDGNFNWAMDAAVDGQGHVFVTDYQNDRVQVFARDGTFLATWGEFGVGPGQFASALGVAVGPDGTVYVTDAGKRLQAFRVGDLPEPAASPTP